MLPSAIQEYLGDNSVFGIVEKCIGNGLKEVKTNPKLSGIPWKDLVISIYVNDDKKIEASWVAPVTIMLQIIGDQQEKELIQELDPQSGQILLYILANWRDSAFISYVVPLEEP